MHLTCQERRLQPRDRCKSLLVVVAGFALLLAVAATATGCGPSGAALSNVVASSTMIVPGSTGIGKPPGVVELRYTLGKEGNVSVRLAGPAASTLLRRVQTAGEHILRFAGVITSSQGIDSYTLVRRAVPPGDYTVSVDAGGETQSLPVKVGGAAVQPPVMQNILLHPDTISPNGDAVDDTADLTFRTSQTSTLSLNLIAHDGTRTTILAPVKRGPGEHNVPINGQNFAGETLPDGVYTATLRAQDPLGNRVEAVKQLTIQAGGKPSITIERVEITPQQVMLGGAISVTITVKNTGKVPLRTQGPDPGYTYTTNDSYSSIEGNKLVDRAGLWRVGADWDGNSGGGGAYRYPFRWGFGHTLQPGETMVTGGKIVILKQESTMWFFAGALQEGVRIVQDRLGRTAIHVGF